MNLKDRATPAYRHAPPLIGQRFSKGGEFCQSPFIGQGTAVGRAAQIGCSTPVGFRQQCVLRHSHNSIRLVSGLVGESGDSDSRGDKSATAFLPPRRDRQVTICNKPPARIDAAESASFTRKWEKCRPFRLGRLSSGSAAGAPSGLQAARAAAAVPALQPPSSSCNG